MRTSTSPRPSKLDDAFVLSQLASVPDPFPSAYSVNKLTTGSRRPGHWNLALAWWLVGLGLVLGAVLGLWSFGGPLDPPAGLERHDGLPRRLLRLAHIALVALPALNLLYVPWLGRTGWSDRWRHAGAGLLLFGTLALPACLAAAAFWRPALVLTPAPVSSLIAAVFILASGLLVSPRRLP
ncbi:MAG: hypothetical protein HY721_25600 [Planctomycetes bacterium]|nr:hypothetical protein [Planctomycetota bacterium]